jgi:CheY-like chemotaxis protein
LNPLVSHTTILVVEDNEEDLFLFQRAVRKARLLDPVQYPRDGEEAISYLAGEGRYRNREQHPLPFLLLLGLFMPRQNGFDVLRWIKTRHELQGLKVVILTASGSERDRSLAMDLGAASYFVKPGSLDEFVQLMLRTQGHWLLLDEQESAPMPPQETLSQADFRS